MSAPAVVRVRDGWREALWAFLGARTLLAVIGVIGGGMLALPAGQPPTDAGFPNPALGPGWHMLFTSLQRQDAQWFLRLATTGYAPGDHSAAFFPGYPVSVRLVDLVPGDRSAGGAAARRERRSLRGAALVARAHPLRARGRGGTSSRPVHRPVPDRVLPVRAVLGVVVPARLDRHVLVRPARPMGLGRGGGRGSGGDPQRRRPADPRPVDRGHRAAAAGRSFAPAASRGGGGGRARPAAVLRMVALAPCRLLGAAGRPARLASGRGARADRRHRRRPHSSPGATRRGGCWTSRSWGWPSWASSSRLAVSRSRTRSMRRPASHCRCCCRWTTRPLLSMPRFAAVLFPVSWGWALASARRRPPETAVLVGFTAGFALLAYLFINWQPVF